MSRPLLSRIGRELNAIELGTVGGGFESQNSTYCSTFMETECSVNGSTQTDDLIAVKDDD